MKTHTVQQGDCILNIAHDNGFFERTVWEHPANQELRKRRRDPNCLKTGDIVVIPDKRRREESCSTGRLHSFRLLGVPAKMAIQLLHNGEPRADEPYTVEIDGVKQSGRTGKDGVVRFNIKPNAKKGSLTIGVGALCAEYDIDLGHLDPHDEHTGIQGRLKNLGYYHGPINGELDDETVTAILVFQHDRGLPCSGELDAATLAALNATHESA